MEISDYSGYDTRTSCMNINEILMSTALKPNLTLTHVSVEIVWPR